MYSLPFAYVKINLREVAHETIIFRKQLYKATVKKEGQLRRNFSTAIDSYDQDETTLV